MISPGRVALANRTEGGPGMTTRADLIIVGAGLAGAAAAWAASARGLDVVVLEAFGPGHRNGSSHGSARIFRRAYPGPLYEVLAGCGVPAELLAPAAAAERWPYFDFTGAGEVMFHAGCGVLDPDRAVPAMLRLAAARGADVRFGTPVTRLETAPGGDGAVARTDRGAFAAPVIAVAAGAWIAPLLDGVVRLPPLTVTQQQVFHFAPAPAPAGSTAEPWPVFIHNDGNYCYGLTGGRDGGVPGAVKVGEHGGFTQTTAAGRDFVVDPAARARQREHLPVHVDGERGLRARPPRPVRRRVALLRPRCQVRPATRRDHRRPRSRQARP